VKGASRLRIVLAQPVRLYLKHPLTNRGRGFVFRQVLRRILPPPPEAFVLRRPGGSLVTLEYQEILGLSAFVNGGFEDAECRLLIALTKPETIAIDVGANVGIHAIPIAASSPTATVLAIEPVPRNARRLQDNIDANSIRNAEVMEVAVGSGEGLITLHVADDPAYASTDAVVRGQREIGQLTVEQTTLDAIWEQAGRPAVSVVKIDVEGAELAVLSGAGALLADQHPSILIEAHRVQFAAVASVLAREGYRRQASDGLEPWNHFFQVTEGSQQAIPI
jgi:FkbM family methyltransferase